jgi:hypothetical protein
MAQPQGTNHSKEHPKLLSTPQSTKNVTVSQFKPLHIACHHNQQCLLHKHQTLKTDMKTCGILTSFNSFILPHSSHFLSHHTGDILKDCSGYTGLGRKAIFYEDCIQR